VVQKEADMADTMSHYCTYILPCCWQKRQGGSPCTYRPKSLPGRDKWHQIQVTQPACYRIQWDV